jgi:hypothetical protein
MKKVLIALLVSFLVVTDVSALTTVNKMEINVSIDSSGIADVTETWSIPKQEISEIKKTFYNTLSADITDLTIKDSNNEYTLTDKKSKSKYTYYLNSQSKSKYLSIVTDGVDNVITLNYKINGFIKSFSDVDGISWYFLSTDNDMDVKSLNITIEGSNYYTADDVGIYGFGNNLECSIKDGKIYLSSDYIGKNNKVLLMTTFTNLKYENAIKVDQTFNQYYKSNKPSIVNDIKVFLASEIIIILIVLIILVIIIVIIRYSVGSKKKIFSLVKLSSKEVFIDNINNASYFEYLPCNGDLYELEFISSYFNITKNRSNIIAAILLKWLINGYAKMDTESESIIVKDNLKFNNELDQELYEIIKEVNSNGEIRKNALNNYANNNHKRIDKWFNNIYIYALNKEISLGNARVQNKKIILNDGVVRSANELVGLKKYLLNFNQVPRKSELTTDVYKDLLIVSCLLGLSSSLSKEILRKNKDNNLAKTLENFVNLRNIMLSTYESDANNIKINGNCLK